LPTVTTKKIIRITKSASDKKLGKEKTRETLTGIVSTGEVVGSIFLAANKLFRVEKLAVSSGPDFINDSGLKIYKDSTRDVLPGTSFTEKGVKGIIPSTNSLVTWHLTIRLQKKKHKNIY
jgi:hypothetical protein